MSGQNVFFNNFSSSQEQQLIEDLTIESIGIYGIEAYYLPKTYGDYDYLYGEDDLGTLSDFYTVPMYINTVCLLYTSPSPRDVEESRMPSSA